MEPERARALAEVLGVGLAEPALPPFFHQAYFWEVQPTAALGRDGHPATGRFIPDLGLPRRMWAGGALTFHAPLEMGRPALRETEIVDVAEKVGQSGPLAFVTLRHEIRQAGRLCVTEIQDLVYRPEAGAGQPLSRPAPADSAPREIALSPVLLFRYSALTFNGHRIHYDVDYAREVERYAGLVVHGPLLAQTMMLRAAETGPLAEFRFRGRSALTLERGAITCQNGATLWVRDREGRLIMEAEATWA